MKLASRRNAWLFLSCVVLVPLIIFVGCCDGLGIILKATTSSSKSAEYGNDLDGSATVVWKVYNSEFVSIWQEPLNKLLYEKGASYKVKIEFYEPSGDDKESYVDTLEKMKQDGEPSDVIALPDTIYPIIADRGLLMPLDDFIVSEKGSAIVNALPVRDLARCKYNGVTYGISAHIRTIGAIAYNKEYLEKYDIDVANLSADIFENVEALQTIKDGEGGKVTPYAYNDNILDSFGLWRCLGLSPIDTAECIAQTQQGATVNLFETAILRETLFKLKGFKDKGLIGFVSESGYDTFFATDTSVHREDVFESSFTYFTSGQGITVETVVVPNINRPQIAPLWGDTQTGIASWSSNKESALNFLTLLYTDTDIANLIQYGTEGKEHTMQNGEAAYLPGNLLWVFGENYTNTFITHHQIDTSSNKIAFQTMYYEKCESFVPDGFRFDLKQVGAEIESVNAVYYKSTDTYELSNTVKKLFTLNTQNIDDAISEINANLKTGGIYLIIEEFDRQLAAWRAAYDEN